MVHKMRPVATIACLCVCLLVTTVKPVKMAEQLWVLFGVGTQRAQRTMIGLGSKPSPPEGAILGGGNVAWCYQPFVELLLVQPCLSEMNVCDFWSKFYWSDAE